MLKQSLQEQSSHKKNKLIKYETLEIQPYIKSELFTQNHALILTSLRSQCVRGIIQKFRNMYKLFTRMSKSTHIYLYIDYNFENKKNIYKYILINLVTT